jgi:hypothetical protein
MLKPSILALLLIGVISRAAFADGTVTGHARFEKIKGHPEAGHVELYESNLFLSPAEGSGTGPSFRLGAPPDQTPTYDGFYRLAVPAGSYSILVNQPLFFIRPKVVPDVLVQDGKTVTRHVELPIDFSTWSTDTWTPIWSDVWYQTFTATGTSITGVSWKLAGTNATRVRASIRAEGADPNPATWPLASAAASKEDSVNAQADNWVRWRSGQVPTTPGARYAVKLEGVQGGDRKFAPYDRAKDTKSYAGGQAFDAAGAAQPYDLHVTVFSDNDGTAILLSKTTEGLGDLRDGYYDQKWAQTFKAVQGTSLASVDVWAAGADNNWNLDFTWRVLKGGPAGTQVGPMKTTKAAYQAFGAGLHGVSFNPGEVPLDAGGIYTIEFTNPIGFNPYVLDSGADAYPDGAGYQNGVLKDGGSVDVSMTIVVYQGGGGTVKGKVSDAGTGRGIEGAKVSVDVLGRTATTGAAGDYEMREVPAGTYTIRASIAGYSQGARTGVAVREGEAAVVDFALERQACTYVFTNGGFETGLAGWTRYGKAKTSNPGTGWFGDIGPADGARFWGNEVNGAGLGASGAWQRLCAEPGHRIRASASSNIYWIAGSASQARSRIGLDPSGGTTAGPGVVWSPWDIQPLSATEGWRTIEVEAPASGPVVTVFLDFDQQDAASPPPGNQWRISCFDGVTVEDLDRNASFDRGDCTDDRSLDISDAVFLLAYLFQGGDSPRCISACDVNDDGSADLSDAVRVIAHLFLGDPPLPAPQGACGPDPTPDALACAEFDC